MTARAFAGSEAEVFLEGMFPEPTQLKTIKIKSSAGGPFLWLMRPNVNIITGNAFLVSRYPYFHNHFLSLKLYPTLGRCQIKSGLSVVVPIF